MLQISCVQQMRPIEILFTVDMNSIEEIESVGVIGEYSPLNWDQPIYLNDDNQDDIYEGTITIQAAYNYAEFKFILNDSIIELEGYGNNRQVDFTDRTSVSYSGIFDQKE